MVLYFLYLRDQDNKILSGTLTQLQKINNGRASSWIKKLEQLIAEYNLDITTYKYGSKNENFHHQLLSHNSLRIVLRKKLQTSFLEEWDVKTSSTSKLSFYRQYKQNHKLENYIVLVNNRRHTSALAKLRCSAHRLKIEIGRYSRFYSEERKRHEQLRSTQRAVLQKKLFYSGYSAGKIDSVLCVAGKMKYICWETFLEKFLLNRHYGREAANFFKILHNLWKFAGIMDVLDETHIIHSCYAAGWEKY